MPARAMGKDEAKEPLTDQGKKSAELDKSKSQEPKTGCATGIDCCAFRAGCFEIGLNECACCGDDDFCVSSA